MKLTTSTGVELDSEGGWAKNATKYAKDKGLEDVTVFLAKHPTGEEEYVIVVGQETEYAHPSYEAIAVHLEIMALAKGMK